MKKDNEIGQRVSELIFFLKKNQSSFAESIGVSQTAIYNTINGKTKPKLDFFQAVLSTYKNVNQEWLMNGEGEMFKEQANESNLADKSQNDYLMVAVKKIEDSFKEVVDEQKEIIKSQRYIIDNLMSQLGLLGKLYLSEEFPPVSEQGRVIEFKPTKVDRLYFFQSSQAASLTVGNI